MKALVVDDSLTMRKIISSYLKALDVQEVDEAGDGAEAVALAAKKAYDLIFMDWNMPVMDGLAALKTLREEGCGAKVVMVTTESEKAKILEAIKCGANNYLTKPVTKDAFLAVVEKLLPK